MPLLILVAFIAIPMIEIALFIEVGGWLGLWPTLALVVLTAVVGTTIIRIQGLAVMERARVAMEQGEPPVGELFHAACLLLAGVLLVTPGFFTDLLGLILLIPPLRLTLGMALWRYLSAKSVIVQGGQQPGAPNPDGGVIDGEFEDVTPKKSSKPSDSKAQGQPEGGKPKAVTDGKSPWGASGKRGRK